MRKAEIIEILDGTHPRVGRSVAFAIYGLIVLSAVIIALETVPGLPLLLNTAFLWTELFIVAVFAAEYLLRLTCTSRPFSYAFSFWGIVDFLAVVPAIVFLFPDLVTLRAMRLLRLLRILKLFKANRALDRISRAFQQVRAELLIFLGIAMVILYLSAVGIYHFEHRAQPEAFSSIPASLWWALATLTTVGYGDIVPITVGGRLFTGLVLMVGFGVIAVPAGLITAALMDSGRRAGPYRADGDFKKPEPENPNTEE
jgi:voltage-gated potassium channel